MYPCPINYYFDVGDNVYLSSIIKKKSGAVAASSIHPDLYISKGEAKIILEYTIYHSWKKPSNKLFGFLIYTPKPNVTESQNSCTSLLQFLFSLR